MGYSDLGSTWASWDVLFLHTIPLRLGKALLGGRVRFARRGTSADRTKEIARLAGAGLDARAAKPGPPGWDRVCGLLRAYNRSANDDVEMTLATTHPTPPWWSLRPATLAATTGRQRRALCSGGGGTRVARRRRRTPRFPRTTSSGRRRGRHSRATIFLPLEAWMREPPLTQPRASWDRHRFSVRETTD